MPGSSNAIDISDTLGIGKDVVIKAKSYLDNNQVSFENVLKKAEESKLKADLLAKDLEVIQEQKKKELEAIFLEKNKLEKERKKIEETSREQIKKIVSSRLEEAEEIIDDLKKLIKAEKLDSTLVFKAGELKNRLKNSKYLSIESSTDNLLERANTEKLSSGDKIFVKSLGRDAIFLSLNKRRNEVEILVGDIKSTVKTEDVFLTTEKPIVKPKIKISRQTLKMQNLEINVIGKNALEAILEVEQFIDSAIVNNVQEIKIIHGIGKGILLKEIREHLKKDKRILEIRKGKYGEGENGVTFAKLK
jgi:DNA mismatch repair protein MutS2